uniref:Uncharacterized protein n=1 Tax=Rhizophora mucronata TaxID=61149 RepID=A0A2P2PPC1_RHIMU
MTVFQVLLPLHIITNCLHKCKYQYLFKV